MSIVACAAPSSPIIGDIEAFLRAAIADLAPDPTEPVGRGRPRVLPALCLWSGLLVSVLRGFASQTDLWRLLTQQGLWDYPRFPVTDQAVYDRLADAGTAPMEQLFAHLTGLLAARLAPFADADLAPFATDVVALDESDLDQMARLLPALRALPARDAGLLGGTLAGVFDLRLQQWRRVAYRTDACQNEKVIARDMVADLPVGSLIVAGCPLGSIGYFGFQWFDDLTDAGYWWVSRLRAGTSYAVIHPYYQDGETFDGLVWLGKHLEEAGAKRAAIVAAVTGDDEDNLVVCQMAKHYFDVPKTIARVNNPRNEGLFRHLGVDEIISPTRMALAAIEQDIPVHELLHLAQLQGGDLELIEAQIGADSPAIGRRPSDITLPDGCSLFVLIRGDQAQTIKPDTVFQADDKVLAISRTECEVELHRQLIGEEAVGAEAS
jgi:trk system potassium uptake protein TrkA